MLKINPFVFFPAELFDPDQLGSIPADLSLLEADDLFHGRPLPPEARSYLGSLKGQLLNSALMQLDPMALAQLVMLQSLAQRMHQQLIHHPGGRLGHLRRLIGQRFRPLPNGAWNRNAPRTRRAQRSEASQASASAVGAESAPTGKGTSGDFLKAALAQNGDNYVFGAETRLNDPNPDTFDCSELVQWAGAQAGVEIPDGSGNQRRFVERHGTTLSVEEAMRTPGALLFREGHVAISLGDGRTIEARGRRHGVGVFEAQGRFTSGGLVPGMKYR